MIISAASGYTVVAKNDFVHHPFLLMFGVWSRHTSCKWVYSMEIPEAQKYLGLNLQDEINVFNLVEGIKIELYFCFQISKSGINSMLFVGPFSAVQLSV